MVEQQPAVTSERIQPFSLTLVLPDHLSADETLAGLARAIGQARTVLAGRAARFWRAAGDCAGCGDQDLRRAVLAGQAIVADEAAAAIDEGIVEAFGLWEQYEAQLRAAGDAAPDRAQPGTPVPTGGLSP